MFSVTILSQTMSLSSFTEAYKVNTNILCTLHKNTHIFLCLPILRTDTLVITILCYRKPTQKAGEVAALVECLSGVLDRFMPSQHKPESF